MRNGTRLDFLKGLALTSFLPMPFYAYALIAKHGVAIVFGIWAIPVCLGLGLSSLDKKSRLWDRGVYTGIAVLLVSVGLALGLGLAFNRM